MSGVRRILIVFADDESPNIKLFWRFVGSRILGQDPTVLNFNSSYRRGSEPSEKASVVGLPEGYTAPDPSVSVQPAIVSSPIPAKLGEEDVEVVLASFQNATAMCDVLTERKISSFFGMATDEKAAWNSWENVLIIQDLMYGSANGIDTINELRMAGVSPRVSLNTTSKPPEPDEPGHTAFKAFMDSTVQPDRFTKCGTVGDFSRSITAAFGARLKPKIAMRKRSKTHDGTKTPPPNFSGGGGGMGVGAPMPAGAPAAAGELDPPELVPAAAAASALLPKPPARPRLSSLTTPLDSATPRTDASSGSDKPAAGRSSTPASLAGVGLDLPPSRPVSPYQHDTLANLVSVTRSTSGGMSASSPLARQVALPQPTEEKLPEAPPVSDNNKQPRPSQFSSQAWSAASSRPSSGQTEPRTQETTSFWSCCKCRHGRAPVYDAGAAKGGEPETAFAEDL